MTHRFTRSAARRVAEVFEASGLSVELGRRAADAVVFVVGLGASHATTPWHAPILAVASCLPVAGITLGSTVYLVLEHCLSDWPLLVHETAHVGQVLERGTPRFLARYSTDYVGLLAKGMAGHEAYLSLPDEQQARRVEHLARRLGAPDGTWLETGGLR